MTAAIRMAVPVADSQLRVNTAGSAVGCATTGGTRCTSWSNPAATIFGAEIPFSKLLIEGSPQRNTTALKISQGRSDRRMSDQFAAPGCPFHRKNTTSDTTEHAAATTSTSHGP